MSKDKLVKFIEDMVNDYINDMHVDAHTFGDDDLKVCCKNTLRELKRYAKDYVKCVVIPK